MIVTVNKVTLEAKYDEENSQGKGERELLGFTLEIDGELLPKIVTPRRLLELKDAITAATARGRA